MRKSTLILTTLVLCFVSVMAEAGEWITAPSFYTHNPATGKRVNQYEPIGPFYLTQSSNYLRSGFRHTRSSLRVGDSADNLFIVEEWGRPVRPFGEWQFPYRPYAVPYSQWGPPYAGFGARYYGNGHGGPGQPGPFVP